MKAAFIQFAPSYLDVAGNWAQIDSLIGSVDADLIVLPELFTSGYFFHSTEHVEEVSEPVPDGPTTARLRTWSSDLGATIVAGLPERDGGHYFNSAVVVHPDETVNTYRKVHLYYEETIHFTPGDLGFPVFTCETRDGASYELGVMVCFDWYFPEAARSLALNGADVIAHPSNLVLPYCPDSMPVRARENHVYTITCNRYGTERKNDEELTFIGLSEICSPTGDVMIQAGEEGEEIGIAEFDPRNARDRQINRYNHVLEDRRPDVYTRDLSAHPLQRAAD